MSIISVQENPGSKNLRKAAAFLLDFFTAFFFSAYVVTRFAGGSTFLGGKTALIAVVFTIMYFVLSKYFGGTLWQRIIRSK